MTIAELLTYKIMPFENLDAKMTVIFSFFLHSAPTIDSRTAINISSERLCDNWQRFIRMNNLHIHIIYADGYKNLVNSCQKNFLGLDTKVTRKTSGYICIRKNKESDCECILRHIRNSIAHNNVSFCNTSNRKYVLFEDYNKNKVLTARILFSQTILTSLKREITK